MNKIVKLISIHSLRMEGDYVAECSVPETEEFQSTPSAWRETIVFFNVFRWILHFNPLPPHGGRRVVRVTAENRALFQSTPSAWRETVTTTAAFSYG